ncbi:MAG: tetratricopeptide repeat protein, partial [Acidobacteria bacterium]|nr:tetratricopeptide repeat protein [Acidobacteriota bacterium]
LLALCSLRAGDSKRASQILAQGLPQAPWLLGRLLAAIEERAGIPPREAPAEIPAAPARFGGLRRGLVYLRSEKWGKALAAFRATPPDNPKVGYGLGVSLYYLGQFEESRQRLLEVLDRLDNPFRSEARTTLGKNTLELGDARGAILLLRQAITAGSSIPDNYYALGLAFLRSGRTTLARRAFERCATPEFVRQRLAETKLLTC